MMTAQGLVYLSQTKPLATKSTDGLFALTLLAFDRIGVHQVEPWRITWFGPKAEAFWSQNANQLKPGQPLHIRVEKLRNFTNGTRMGGPEFVVSATSIDIAPTSHKRGQPVPSACISY